MRRPKAASASASSSDIVSRMAGTTDRPHCLAAATATRSQRAAWRVLTEVAGLAMCAETSGTMAAAPRAVASRTTAFI